MKAKPYTVITVRMPNELHEVLETIAIAKGETLSVVVRDLARQAVVEARRVDHGVTPATAKDFR
jgi:predicted DNA-binding protein